MRTARLRSRGIRLEFARSDLKKLERGRHYELREASMSARSEVVTIWDTVVAGFLRDGTEYLRKLPKPLDSWFKAYAGKDDGKVVRNALPEPYIGDLAAGKIRAITLGLNPGQSHLDLQGRNGRFAKQIRQRGSYHSWAATLPYFGETWRTAHGRNRFHESRLRFLRDWFGSCLRSGEMLTFELYPWHSKRVTGDIRPDPHIVRQFIWEPIAEMGNPIVFAFGAPWMDLVEPMGLKITARLGFRRTSYGSSVPSRSVLVACTPEGGTVIVEKHRGGAGPPNRVEAERLRDYVVSRLGVHL
jgi:hypothetical protein